MSAVALYVHWPFCLHKCPYCDFNSHVRDTIETKRWQQALLTELDYFAAHTNYSEVTSIFFGGGTPSLMAPETVAAILKKAAEHWSFTPDIEITLEANPTSVEAEKFRHFREAGINRLSLGVQSLREESLRFLGRQHSVTEAKAAIRLARETFPRFTFDLIYARPEQTPKDWEAELEEALEEATEHLSVYQLTIEPGTQFHHRYHAGAFRLPRDESSEAMYFLTQEKLEKAGLPAYEISNHARPGSESRHNLTYWHYGDYIGIGPGAHGRILFPHSPPGGESAFQSKAEEMLVGGITKAEHHPHGFAELADARQQQTPLLPQGGAMYTANAHYATATLRSPEKWLQQVEAKGHGLDTCHTLNEATRLEECLMMGLRLKRGIPRERFPALFGQEPEALLPANALSQLKAADLLICDEQSLRTTTKGFFVLNTILAELCAPR